MRYFKHLFCLLIVILSTFNMLSAQTSNIVEGCAVLEVDFFPPSSASSYDWDFGDGGTSTVMSPTHNFVNPGNYTVEFRETNGGPVIGTITIDVYPKPDLNISADPQSGCRPLTTTFDASSSVVDDNITINNYNWNYGDATPSENGANPTHTFDANLNSYNILLEITTGFPSCDVSEQFTDFITLSQPANVGFTADPSGSCEAPVTISFTNTSDPGLTYMWDFGDGTSSTETNPSHTFNSEGNYQVILTATDGTGCSASSFQIIGIGDPVASFEIPDTICLGSEITIMNNSVSGSYDWDFGNGTTSNDQNPSITYSSGGEFEVSLTVTIGLGCMNTSTKTVFVDDVRADFTIDPTYTCDGILSADFTPEVINDDFNYIWTFGDFTTSTETSPTHVFDGIDDDPYSINEPITYVNSLTVVNPETGCTDTQLRFDTISRPNARFMPDVLDGCAPLTVEFSDSSLLSFYNEPIVEWEYNFGDGTNEVDNTGDPVTHTFTDAGEYDVTLTITNDIGCKDTSFVITIEVGAPSNIDFAADKLDVCPDEIISFTPTMDNDDVDAWHFETDGGRSFHCYQENELDYAYATETGVFDVSLVTEYNGCLDTLLKEDYINVRGPIADLYYEMDCEAPFTVQFRDSSHDATAVIWNFGDGTTSTNFEPMHTFPDTGDYKVILTAVNSTTGCEASLDSAIVCIRTLEAAFELDTMLCTGREYELNASTSLHVDARCWRGYTWDIPNNDRPITTEEEVTIFVFGTPGVDVVELAVEDINGCRDTATLEVEVFEVMPNFAVDDLSICFPSDVNFTDLSTSILPIVEWEWDFGDGGMSTDQNPSHTYTTANNTPIPVTLVVTDSLGCNGTSQQFINVYEPTSTISPTPLAICEGDEITVSASDFTTQGSNLTYSWDMGNGVSSTDQSVTTTYNTPGTYTITLNYEEVATGCVGPTRERTIEVQGYPDAAFTTSVDGMSPICAPAAIDFFDASISGSPLNYSWNFDNGLSSTAANTSSNFGPGIYEVELTVSTIPAGCSDMTSTSFEVVGAEGDFTIDENIICSDGTITVNLVDDVNVSNYSWDFGDGTTVDNQSPVTHTFNVDPAIGTVTVTLILKDDNDCEFSVQKQVNILNTVADFSDDNLTSCVGVPFPFMNLSLNSDSYLWDFGNGETSTLSDPSTTYTETGVYTVTLTATNTPFGCTDQIMQTIEILDVLEIEAMGGTMCPGGSTMITINGEAPPGTYSWTPANFLVDPSAEEPTVIGLSQNTTFTLNYVADSGCTGTTTAEVTVDNTLETLEAVGDDICAGQVATLSLTGPVGAGPFSRTPAELLVDATVANPTTTPLNSNTTFTVTYTTAGGCTGMASAEVSIIGVPAPFEGDTIINLGSSLTLPEDPNGIGETITWVNDSTNVAVVGSISPDVTSTYTGISNNPCGDVDYTYTVIVVVPPIAPNIFTPNGDQLNELFTLTYANKDNLPLLEELEYEEFKVYNRWGNLVFDIEDSNRDGWNGNYRDTDQAAPADVYLFFIKARYAIQAEGEVYEFVGDVTLAR